MATEVKQRNNRVFVLVGAAVALAAGAALLLISHSSSSSGTGTAGGQQVNVVVAKVDLVKGQPLTVDALTTGTYSIDSVPAGAVSDPTQLVGKYLAIDVTRNTPITASMYVVDANSAKTAALASQPLPIHDGYVAMALPADGGGGGGDKGSPEVVAVGGFIQPEDHIDLVIDSGQGSVRYALQDIRVIKVGTVTGQATAGTAVPSILVVELPRAQAKELAYLIAKKVPVTAPGQTAPAASTADSPHILQIVLRNKNQSSTPDPDPKKGYLCANNTKGVCANYLSDNDQNGQAGVPPTTDTPISTDSFEKLFPGR